MELRGASLLLLPALIACSTTEPQRPPDTPAGAGTKPAAELSSPAEAHAPTPKGYVTVVCHPFCDVFEGERALGPSPLERAELSPGPHRLILRRDGQPDKEIEVSVKADEVTSVRMNMAPPVAAPKDIATQVSTRNQNMDGFLTLVCDPGCDDVLVDGKRSLGKGPYVSVPVAEGAHKVTLKRAGIADRLISVSVIAGQTTALKVAMSGIMQVAPDAAPPPGARKIPKDELEMRARLEPKVFGGTATEQEIQLLKALCSQHADFSCRDRADAMLKKAGAGRP